MNPEARLRELGLELPPLCRLRSAITSALFRSAAHCLWRDTARSRTASRNTWACGWNEVEKVSVEAGDTLSAFLRQIVTR